MAVFRKWWSSITTPIISRNFHDVLTAENREENTQVENSQENNPEEENNKEEDNKVGESNTEEVVESG